LIADELRAMEGNLNEFDPEREPWPKMEEDEISSNSNKKQRRKVSRRKATPSVKTLESHEPEGEWNIDSQDVDMLDLLDEGESTRMIRLGRIQTIDNLLLGEEE
jgi:hypothetical protein